MLVKWKLDHENDIQIFNNLMRLKYEDLTVSLHSLNFKETHNRFNMWVSLKMLLWYGKKREKTEKFKIMTCYSKWKLGYTKLLWKCKNDYGDILLLCTEAVVTSSLFLSPIVSKTLLRKRWLQTDYHLLISFWTSTETLRQLIRYL